MFVLIYPRPEARETDENTMRIVFLAYLLHNIPSGGGPDFSFADGSAENATFTRADCYARRGPVQVASFVT